ncbi:type IVB secretion system protein IcmH/DotU [Winslowiella iniecta]|uniref:type IVB secretion system protein IcmH/DotU n=1 Tax=Winslowiella iniecta TaxID=1560201 RepID=UPI00092D6EB5|nr:type IVB secretion system protein IcmH/DotU [Winslowiella iniecta]
MNEFEQKIRDAMSSSRNGLQQINGILSSPVVQASVGGMAAFVATARNGADDSRAEGFASKAEETPLFHPGAVATGGESYVSTPARKAVKPAALTRPGSLAGNWANPCVAAAMPALLMMERIRAQQSIDNLSIRAQMLRELQHFSQVLLKQQMLPEDVRRMSYLLCTYLDGMFAELREYGLTAMNLLIELHRDSWGGEKCFDDLDYYLQNPHQFRNILGLYHLILSMGFKGKYHVLERGDVLLADLFIRLNTTLYEKGFTQSLSRVKTNAVTGSLTLFTPLKVLSYGLLVCLMVYGGGSFLLHDKSREIRNAIMVWEPPVPRKINIMETLPQPLPAILNEGWLEVREDPRGWLLLFTSDGAFRTGKSVLSPEFVKKRNIERLGEALAGWPGDLEVIGHTDAQPFRNNASGDPNMRLSQERASMVAEKLKEGTLVNSKYQRNIVAVGKGDTEPLADNSTDEGRRKNRRVDILWKVGERSEIKNKMTESHLSEQTPGLLNNKKSTATSAR